MTEAGNAEKGGVREIKPDMIIEELLAGIPESGFDYGEEGEAMLHEILCCAHETITRYEAGLYPEAPEDCFKS